MFALRTQVAGARVGIDNEGHADCTCVGVVLTLPDGSKLALDFKDAAGVEALGWALLQAAEAMRATHEAQHADAEAHAHP